jgi:dihydrofolate reductase
MRVTMVTVMSVDARITQGNTVKTTFWRSAEDGVILKELIARHEVLVMGRKTYDVVRPKPSEKHLQVILTSQPEAYADQVVPGSREFVSLDARQLVATLEARGYQSLLLLGGTSNIPFIEAGLVDDLYLTVEPSIFGAGQPLVESLPAAVPLKLVKHKQLNRQGTLLLQYEVIKNTAVTDAQL